MSLVVTPEVLRTTQQAIESALEHATSIANGYLSSHEGLGSAVWGGQAQLASVNTAVQIGVGGDQSFACFDPVSQPQPRTWWLV